MSIEHVAALVCSHVFADSLPILFVARRTGRYQFQCGVQHPSDEVPKLVGIDHLLKRGPTLSVLLKTGGDWFAERTAAGEDWVLTELGGSS